MFQTAKMSETQTVLLRARPIKQPPDKGFSNLGFSAYKENINPVKLKSEKTLTDHQSRNQQSSRNGSRKPLKTFDALNAAIQICTNFEIDTHSEASSKKVFCTLLKMNDYFKIYTI